MKALQGRRATWSSSASATCCDALVKRSYGGGLADFCLRSAVSDEFILLGLIIGGRLNALPNSWSCSVVDRSCANEVSNRASRPDTEPLPSSVRASGQVKRVPGVARAPQLIAALFPLVAGGEKNQQYFISQFEQLFR